MQRVSLSMVASSAFLLASLFGIAGCGPGSAGETSASNPEGECQVDDDCPGAQTCNLLTNTCQSGGADTGGSTGECQTDGDCPGRETCDRVTSTCISEDDDSSDDPDGNPDAGMPEDTREPGPDTTSPGDTSEPEDSFEPQDTFTPDTTGWDADAGDEDEAADGGGGQADGGVRETDTFDAGVDSGGDAGGPTFSGCSNDSQCSDYLVCDESIGRCKDPRMKCSGPSDCSSGASCVFGRCTATCSGSCASPGLSCESITFSDGSSSSFCLDSCNTFGSSGQSTCGEDTQCVPVFGNSDGVCRGVGRKRLGQSCQTDYGENACAEGSFCVNRRGTKTCQKLCSSSGTPGCGSGEFCFEAFFLDKQYNEVSNPAGFCLDNCGGLGNTNSSICPSGQACDPVSGSHGYCTPQGTVTSGGACGGTGSPYCTTSDMCLESDSQYGICRPHCDPSKLATANACGSNQACIGWSSDFGYCVTACWSDSNCPFDRSDCAPVKSGVDHRKPTSGEPDVCFPN